ncbi:uncharacterized protein PgNI_07677 [Pyricularia grisea]|uniref:Uncharacterized protein n=1 Tax=Pyricularia grisea TaxID=148305 RepID=A0A6P8B3C8_PYRGI|nr:uncharacterized protein PgNI_07677 [Pyricularia grisea]TLD09420.1 hypothetical protein PgNI_07677 [Pyricularia grisea]
MIEMVGLVPTMLEFSGIGLHFRHNSKSRGARAGRR